MTKDTDTQYYGRIMANSAKHPVMYYDGRKIELYLSYFPPSLDIYDIRHIGVTMSNLISLGVPLSLLLMLLLYSRKGF